MRTVDYDYQQPVVAGQPSFNNIRVSPDKIRYSGIIKALYYDRGFGFIFRNDSRSEVFFKLNGNVFMIGQKVSFSIIESIKGPLAVDIRCNRRA